MKAELLTTSLARVNEQSNKYSIRVWVFCFSVADAGFMLSNVDVGDLSFLKNRVAASRVELERRCFACATRLEAASTFMARGLLNSLYDGYLVFLWIIQALPGGATVTALDSMTADALGIVLFVLGPDVSGRLQVPDSPNWRAISPAKDLFFRSRG